MISTEPSLRLLFDQNIPQPLLRHITGHELLHTYHAGWEDLVNGDLIAAAEAARFDVLVTADQSLRYQQNLAHPIQRAEVHSALTFCLPLMRC